MEGAVSIVLRALLVALLVAPDLKFGEFLWVHAQRVPLDGEVHQLKKLVSRHKDVARV
jgi:hypothetical protein